MSSATPHDFYLLGASVGGGAGTFSAIAPVPEPASAPAPAPAMPALDLSVVARPLIVFDTETTTLRTPIVLQLAFIHVEDGAVVEEYNRLWHLPHGARIDADAQRVHGISAERVRRDGVGAAFELERFHDLCAQVLARGGRVVAHNANFDVKALNLTAAAHGSSREWRACDCFCTMRESKKYSPHKTKNGFPKAFKNSEFYEFLRFEPPAWAKLHDAFGDVRVTLCNYVKAVELGWF